MSTAFCLPSLEVCLARLSIHTLVSCLANPFQHSPSENHAFFSRVSHSSFSTSRVVKLELRKKRAGKCSCVFHFRATSPKISSFSPSISYQGGQIQQLRLATLRWADDGRLGITLPIAISHGFRMFRTADSGNLKTKYNVQICSLIDLACCFIDMGVSIVMGVPKMDVLLGKIPLEWMIWGYPHSWKSPYVSYMFVSNVFPTHHMEALRLHEA